MFSASVPGFRLKILKVNLTDMGMGSRLSQENDPDTQEVVFPKVGQLEGMFQWLIVGQVLQLGFFQINLPKAHFKHGRE